MMPDISQTLAAKSDQLNGDDLIGGPITITVRGVKVGADEQPVSIRYDGDAGKPYKPCLSMRRVLAHAWGADSDNWLGKAMTLYRLGAVKFGDLEVGGIRISHLSHIDKARLKIPLTATRGRKVAYEVERLGDAPARVEEKRAVLSDEIRAQAIEAASRGSEAFRDYWKSEAAKPHRAALQSILTECQTIAKTADDQATPPDEAETDGSDVADSAGDAGPADDGGRDGA